MEDFSVTTENELIMKSYYQSIIDENKEEHPIKMLGEMYMEEMKKEQPELSEIRFAQGEVYFLNHDYEAAIHKWQHPLDSPFVPWGQKNIADAHMEMGLLDDAEKFYKEVDTDSVILQTEVLLQLFSLYIQKGQQEKSVDTIKQAVQLNPDYTDVTEIAKHYFENIEDWDSAIELAVNEAIRTQSIDWFEVLEGYADRDLTANHRPNYFHHLLETLFAMDKHRFERLTDKLWKSYQQSDFHLNWLEEMNLLLLEQDLDDDAYQWEKLPSLFEEGYFYLISGKFFINDISNLMKDHLMNWQAMSSASDRLTSSTAILAWNEHFQSELAAGLVNEAENGFEDANPNQQGREEGIELFDSINRWAEQEGLLDGLTEFMQPTLRGWNMEKASPSEIRNVIQEALGYILEQKKKLENVILQDIDWNEGILTELRDFHVEIEEMEKEKSSTMTSSFRDVKNKLMKNIEEQIPKLLSDCSDLVKEDSDFSNLHVVLNEEMNRRIAQYMEKNMLSEFRLAFEEWLETCDREFQESQVRCNEFSENINEQFNAEKLALSGDFKILDDWKRDIERISRVLLRPEEVNILLRNNPAQLLLKGAGKLLGSISKNQDRLFMRYKDYIENADYSEVAGEITKTFTQQLELFEESIAWDVSEFYSNPQEELGRLIEEVEVAIEKQNDSLNKMHEKPEIYQDPLTLFELKLRHYELKNMIEVTG